MVFVWQQRGIGMVLARYMYVMVLIFLGNWYGIGMVLVWNWYGIDMA